MAFYEFLKDIERKQYKVEYRNMYVLFALITSAVIVCCLNTDAFLLKRMCVRLLTNDIPLFINALRRFVVCGIVTDIIVEMFVYCVKGIRLFK